MRPALLLGFLMFAGCPAPSDHAPREVCTKQFEQCKLPGGPLGVCDRRECKDGESPPCLVCMPQH